MEQKYIPKTAMFIYAHPDDIEFCAAGTAAIWALHGCNIVYVLLTNGSAGSQDPTVRSKNLAKTRRIEQISAANIVGVRNCIFMDYEDGLLQPTLALRKQVVRLIRQYKPNVVVCGDPTAYYSNEGINHPDHRVAAQIAFEAVFPACELPLLYPDLIEEGILPHKVNYVYVCPTHNANLYVDVTETIQLKVQAICQYNSQIGNWDPTNATLVRATEIGKKVNITYAESFFRITLNNDPEGIKQMLNKSSVGIFKSDQQIPSVDIFPHVLIRIAGGPFEKFQELTLQNSIETVDRIQELESTLEEIGTALSDMLYDLVPSVTNSGIRSKLIQLRRDVFNQRIITKDVLDYVRPYLSDDLLEKLINYIGIAETLTQLSINGECVYKDEVIKCRKKLVQLSKEDNLRKGLLLSSQNVLSSIYDYEEAVYEGVHGKRERKIELTLIKYLSRIYAKTSPFSTFTNLNLLTLSALPIEDGISVPSSLSPSPEINSHIRLNNQLFKYIKTLLIANSDISRRFFVQLNPTLNKENNQFLYLTNHEETEVFQRIPVDPVLELIHELVSANKEGVEYQELIQSLTEFIDTPVWQLEKYISELIEYGFLEFKFDVSAVDPDWDIKLCEKLEPLTQSSPLLSDLINALRKVRELAHKYEKADFYARQNFLSEAFESFRDMCVQLGGSQIFDTEKTSLEGKKNQRAEESDSNEEKSLKPITFKQAYDIRFGYKPEKMFYEDTVVNHVPSPVTKKRLTELISKLHKLLQALNRFESHYVERERMKHYFVQKYGAKATVDLLTFYEDYSRDVKLPLDKQRHEDQIIRHQRQPVNETTNSSKLGKERATEHPSRTKWYKKNSEWEAQLADELSEEVLSQKTVNISLAQIEAINSLFPVDDTFQQKHGSYTVLLQLFTDSIADQDTPLGVLNGISSGYGKLFSRFLHLFDVELTEEIRQRNNAMASQQNVLFAENTGTNYFNADIHPSLMPYEIWLPGSQNSLATEHQIPVTELQLCLNTSSQRIQLIHKPTQKPVHVFDLGFLTILRRSKLYQLLESFTFSERVSASPISKAINNILSSHSKDQYPHIFVRPRVVYENQIILFRKAWFIPYQLLPFRGATESDWQYFCRVNQWRQQNGIPKEVFISVMGNFNHSTNINDVENPEALKKHGKDDYKPQYISFENPILVDLFNKLLSKVSEQLQIEEMLPGRKHLTEINGSHYVKEYKIQWFY